MGFSNLHRGFFFSLLLSFVSSNVKQWIQAYVSGFTAKNKLPNPIYTTINHFPLPMVFKKKKLYIYIIIVREN